MPLIIISGIPCSGKTECAQKLQQHFTKLDKNVIMVSENDFIKDRSVYNTSNEEKTVRSSVKAAVIRAISTTNVVILDAPNYIKGYRYELYCVAKQHCTTHCVVQCVVSTEQAWQWNEARPATEQYSRETFDALAYRYEAPDSRNRWDSPLFPCLHDTPADVEGITVGLLTTKTVKPHQATQLQPLSSNNFLHDLDRQTQEVISAILTAQKTEAGDEIKIPGSVKILNLGRKVSLPELSRARRQFISYIKTHPGDGAADVQTCFVTYMNTTLA